MPGEYFYLQQVERTLQQLRYLCLGQNVSFVETLPPHIRMLSKEEQARHVTDQLIFALAAVAGDVSSEELRRSKAWLQSMVTYTMFMCDTSDHIFRNLCELLQLPQEVRSIMASHYSGDYSMTFAKEADAPTLLTEHLDEAVLRLLQSCGMMERYKDAHEKAVQFLKNNLY